MTEICLEAGQVEKYFYLITVLGEMKLKVQIWNNGTKSARLKVSYLDALGRMTKSKVRACTDKAHGIWLQRTRYIKFVKWFS